MTYSSVRNKVRFTTYAHQDLIEAMKDIVYWYPGLTVSEFVEKAIDNHLLSYKQQAKHPIPKRPGAIKRGPPI